jgi:hypothetical protein
VTQSLLNPTKISIASEQGLINVIDEENSEIVQFDQYGQVIKRINQINGKNLNSPVRFVVDDTNGREWLVDSYLEQDYIYTRNTDDENYTLLDSLYYSGDLEINPTNGSCWIISYNAQNSAVVQLSTTGTRQLELSGFYNPYDIQVNPYDGTLLVADSGHQVVVHFTNENDVLGQTNYLNFPVKILIE